MENDSTRLAIEASAYAAHDFADFAQEFLRRNTDYRAEFDRTAKTKAPTETATREGLAGRWGLSWPFRPSCIAATRARIMATQLVAASDQAPDGANRHCKFSTLRILRGD
ncbi:DUF6499 domain-containing protein [Blastomonas sp. AAP53]|uniref:transcriptional regulator domain-containing protein n=1 Tax=Blastomonas sp. AAP53 TaxID=1248760 RepID=UPI001EE6746B|nr:DUF6499 domain-containing protein [Blastomonas sp. AAP53]